jgi:cytochrome P450
MNPLDALLAAPEFVADPYPAYRRLREEAPVYWSDAWGAWVFTAYEDVVATLRDPEHFSSSNRLIELLDQLPDEIRSQADPIRHHYSTTGLIHADPPDHSRLRSLISKAFSARVIQLMEPRIQGIVNELVGAVADKGRMDVVSDLAYPLPAIVIAELLGAPAADRDRFKRWSDDIVAFQGTGRAIPEAIERSRDGLVEMRGYLADLFEDHRRSPRDGLLGNLVRAEEAEGGLTTEELYSTCVTFLIAGHETTTSLITNGLYTLLRHPDQLAAVRRDRARLPNAIEECLRYESPVQRAFRRVTEDFEYGGCRMRAGQITLQLLGAANRDPNRFADPDRFDISRHPNRHIAFGTGIHFCIGAPLARLEASIALTAIFDRLEDLQLETDKVVWQSEKTLFRCLESLPLTFTPRMQSGVTDV